MWSTITSMADKARNLEPARVEALVSHQESLRGCRAKQLPADAVACVVGRAGGLSSSSSSRRLASPLSRAPARPSYPGRSILRRGRLLHLARRPTSFARWSILCRGMLSSHTTPPSSQEGVVDYVVAVTRRHPYPGVAARSSAARCTTAETFEDGG